jgi:LCP family protein required for cell wall assembly
MKSSRSIVFVLGLIVVFILILPAVAQDESAIPEPMPIVDEAGYDIVNFLLLGSDTTNPQNSGRTDVILIVSVNRTAGTIAFLSIPRDLYVYIPGWQSYRINSAYGHGETAGGEGQGIHLLKETILYNLGIQIDYYARVDFNGFKNIIDSLGGIELSVDCAIEDWRLRDPDLDPTLEDSWEMFTLPVGVHRMDSELALWYVRSRRTSSDFDRGRRQQDMMRAIWRHVRELGLLNQLPDIWQQVTEMVKTDITLPDMVGLIPLAVNIDTSRIVSYTFHPNIEVKPWRSPEGSSVLLPIREAIMDLERKMVIPPTESRLVREGATVNIINASGIRGLDRVAADRLAWEGFVPVISNEPAPYRNYTIIYDHTGRAKGNSLGILQRILRVNDEAVVREPDANRDYDFQVLIGGSYYSCTHGVLPPDS